MRSFLIDEITPENLHKVETWLSEHGLASCLDHLYHFPVPAALLTPMQREHEPVCGPFYMAAETGHDSIRLELLVRAGNILRCNCMAYATSEQQEDMIARLENLLTELGIPL